MCDLTVVVPTYERPAQLERLLSSLASAGMGRDFAVIVVDDGSPPDAYASLIHQFPVVKWLRQDRRGPACARNRGWRAASSDDIVFIDDDCVVRADTIAQLRSALEDLDAVGATIVPLDRGRLVAEFMHAERLVTHKVEDGVVRWLVTACVAIRRAALESVEGFDEEIAHGGEDVDLSRRLQKAGYKLGVTRDAIVAHDHRAGLRQLVRTYYRHGTGQRRLVSRHPERRQELGQSVIRRLRPAEWLRVYGEYRVEHGVVTSVAFIALRAAMMVPWLAGAYRGQSRWART